MLRTGWIAFFTYVYLSLAILGASLESTLMSGDKVSKLKGLTAWTELHWHDVLNPTVVIGAGTDFFNSLFAVITFDLAFLSGDEWIIFKYFAHIFAAVAVYGLIMTVIGIFSRDV